MAALRQAWDLSNFLNAAISSYSFLPKGNISESKVEKKRPSFLEYFTESKLKTLFSQEHQIEGNLMAAFAPQVSQNLEFDQQNYRTRKGRFSGIFLVSSREQRN